MKMRCCIGLLWVLASVHGVSADPPARASHPFWHNWFGGAVCPPVVGCPDDYCRKPMPSICPLPRCGGVDDYCRKPMPCVPAIPRCGLPDDYCRKSLPCLLCPPLASFFRCGPTDGSCSASDKR